MKVTGEQNPARFLRRALKAAGAQIDEDSFHRMEIFCDESVTDGFVVRNASEIASRMQTLSDDSGVRMRAYVRNGIIYCEPSDPLGNRAVD